MLEIIPFPALKDNYIWLLKNKASNQIAIVDPGEATPLLRYIESEKLDPVAILITHHHWDHVNGIEALGKRYDMPVYTPKQEQVKGSTKGVSEGDQITLTALDLTLDVLDVPGHTLGAKAYFNEEMVFTGDTLFAAGCGRLFEGTPEQMHRSLNKIMQLNDETFIYCGHEYTLANLIFAATVEPENQHVQTQLEQAKTRRDTNQPTLPTTLAIEKNCNSFLRCDQESVITAASHYAGKNLVREEDVFAVVRQWKDNF